MVIVNVVEQARKAEKRQKLNLLRERCESER